MLFRKIKKKPNPFENRVIFRDWKRDLEQDDFSETSDDPILSTLVQTLNVFGKYGFDTDKATSRVLRRECADWIEKVLSGAGGTEGEKAEPVEWRRLAEFYRNHRRGERQYVVQCLGSFKDLIWDFIRQTTAAVSVERDYDDEIRDRLNRLRDSVDGQSVLEIRREVLDAAQFIGKVLEDRERRQNERMHELGARLREMRAELTEVRRELALDPLTRVHNRSALDQQLTRIVQLAQFSGTPACLLMVDADFFKSINDNFGHQHGDSALRRLAADCVKTFPRETDFIARYGGDEFVVIIDDVTLQIAERLATSLLTRVQETRIEVGTETLSFTVSIGLALLRHHETPSEWMHRADEALRIAKEEGRNRLISYDTLERSLVDPSPELVRPACEA